MSARIRGEYWIQDGWVSFADGEVGDQNHEMVAINHFAGKHVENLARIAEDLGVDISNRADGRWTQNEEHPAGDAEDLREKIIASIENKEIEWRLPSGVEASDSADEYLMKALGVDDDEYWIIFGNGDARALVMEKEGWIAVRSNNAELFGYEGKKNELASGIEEILEQEGVNAPDEEVEMSVYDHKSKRSFDVTLADLKGPSAMRPQTLPNTTYNKPLFVPADRSGPMGSQSPRYLDVRARSLEKTSESTTGFRAWLLENCGSFMVRRTWPDLIASEMEPPARRSSRRNPRFRRR